MNETRILGLLYLLVVLNKIVLAHENLGHYCGKLEESIFTGMNFRDIVGVVRRRFLHTLLFLSPVLGF